MTGEAQGQATKNKGLEQFIKFCIIGLTSTVIDFAVLNALIKHAHFHWLLAGTISFSLAVTNGYIWNSLWTFKGMGSGAKHQQYVKFVAVNIVGYILNILIMKGIITLLATAGGGPHLPTPQLHVNIAKGIAVIFVSAWNFLANRKWTFA